MLPGPLRLPVATLLILAACPVYLHYASATASRTLAQRLSATRIDVSIDRLPVADAIHEVSQTLAAKDQFFKACRFQLDAPDSGCLISMELTGVSGDECLKYLTELSANRYFLRPRKVVIASLHADPRGIVERATASTEAWFRGVWLWAGAKLGHHPPAPIDPFVQN
jgi:hypothetical protein